MPTILYEQGFRFAFYSADRREPPHVHVFKGGAEAKWWLDPIAEARNWGFRTPERAAIRRIIRANHGLMLQRWREEFPEVQ
jgi:hypothetical protein